MAKFSGSSGTATFGGTTINITGWTVDIKVATKDVTDSSSSAWKDFIADGFKEWTGSCEGFQESSTADLALGGTAASLVLSMASGKTYTGNAILTQLGTALQVTGTEAVKKTYSFQGTGALTLANS